MNKIVKGASLWILFFTTFFFWWWTMTLLFQNGLMIHGVVLAYSIPVVVTVLALLKTQKLAHLLVLVLFLVGFVVYIASLSFPSVNIITMIPQADKPIGPFHPTPIQGLSNPFTDLGAILGIAFISTVITIMTFPAGGVSNYFRYRKPLFVFGVIFMPLFIAIAALMRVPVGPDAALGLLDKGWAFFSIMIGFWLSAALLVMKKVHGEWAPGLQLKPGMPFRPDYILPGGINFVKGVILMGVGIMIMVHDHLSLPRWEWWGFVVAFFGIITLIPLRGMFKMFFGKRARLLGERGGFSLKASLFREIILYIGLILLLFGFVNAFKGFVPFKVLGTTLRYAPVTAEQAAFVATMFLISFLILVLFRAWYKTRLEEGIESNWQLLAKNFSLWLGVILLVLGFIHLFNLPADAVRFESQFVGLYPTENPFGFALGLTLFILGSSLILLFRPFIVRHEFEALLKMMPAMLADLPENVRKELMRKRLLALASLSDEARLAHISAMMQGLEKLPKPKRMEMREGMMKGISQLPDQKRSVIMNTMSKIM